MKKSERFYGWKNVIYLAILLAIFGPAAVAVANLFQPHVTQAFDVGNSAFAVSNILMLGIGIFLSPIVSVRYAKGDFKKIYLMGSVIYIIGLLGMAFSPNIWVFYAMALVVGTGYIFTCLIPASLLINKWFVKQRSLATSIAYSGLGIGGMFFSQLLTFLLDRIEWRFAYVAYALIMLFVCVPIIKWGLVVEPEDIGQAPLQEDKDQDQTNEKAMDAVNLPVDQMRSTSFFWLTLIGAILVGISNNGGLGQFPPFLTELHGAQATAQIVTIYSGVGIIGKLVIGTVNDKFGLKVSTFYGTGMLIITYLLATKAANYNIAIAMAICFGMGNAISTVLPPLVATNIYPAEGYAELYGYISGGVTMGMTLGSFVAASIADATGSYINSWIAMAVISALVAVCWLISYREVDKYKD